MKLFILFFIFSSCSSFKLFNFNSSDDNEIKLSGYNEFSQLDYVEHLKSYEDIYRDNEQKNIVKLKPVYENYLSSLIKNISQNNELFYVQEVPSTFYIVKSKIPFHFSLPGRKFFFSSTLLDKYIKNETILYCVLTYELIRSEKLIYNKRIIVPTGNLSTQRILSLLRLNTNDNVEIHKWAYYHLKRIGLETDTYLTWLQVKNRNSLDFIQQLGDTQSISIEESKFKAFLIKNAKNGKRNIKYKGSSKKFYAFINSIKG